MTQALSLKLLAVLLAVLLVIAGLIARGGRVAVQLTPEEKHEQQIIEKKMTQYRPSVTWFRSR